MQHYFFPEDIQPPQALEVARKRITPLSLGEGYGGEAVYFVGETVYYVVEAVSTLSVSYVYRGKS